jgi:hypothetical protein
LPLFDQIQRVKSASIAHLERRMKIRIWLFAGLWLVCTGLISPVLVSPASAQSLKPGTPIQVQLLTPLDTGTAQAGQEFAATLAQPVTAGKTVWPKGTQVKGKVLEVVSSGRLSRPASITLQIIQIGNSPVMTEPEQIDGKSHAGRNAGLIIGGAAAGAILGSIAGGGKGAVIGTAAGAGAGTLTAAATGKHEIVLRAETPLNFAVPGAAAAAAPPPPPPPPAAEPPQPVYRESRERIEAPPAYEDSRERKDEYRDRGYDDGDRRRDDRDREYDDHPHRFRMYFSDRDERMIREYFRSGDYGRGLPPGLARRNSDLPPGLEKRLHRGETLPPGLERRAEPFPEDLDRRLEPLPRGYSRVILSGRAMILRDDGDIVDMMFIYE